MNTSTFADVVQQAHPRSNSRTGLNSTDSKKEKGAILSARMKDKIISLKAFANETSAHGFKNATSGSRHRRVVWLLAIIGAMGFLTYNLVTVFVDYSNYPFRTVFQIAPQKNVKFPAVTICNLNIFDASKYKYHEELTTIQRIISGGPFAPNVSLASMKDTVPYDVVFAENYFNLANTNSTSIEETFVYCAWHDDPIDCREHISYIVTPIGRCFQFNQNASTVKTALRPGAKGGFSAILKIDPDVYTKSEYDAVGVRVLLHDQYDYPDVFSRGILFSPGFTYYVSFLLNSFKFLSYPYKAFGKDGYCTAADKTDYAPEDEHYSMKSCIYHRASEATEKECGCSEKTCSVYDFFHCYKPLFEEYYENTTTTENIFDCAFACNFAYFDPVYSSAKFPSENGAEIISEALNMTTTDINKSLLQINLFFEDFVVRESHHVATYGDWFSILAMLGGNMGLFLGASLLTFGELLELLLIYILTLKDKLTCCFGTKRVHGSSTLVDVRPMDEDMKK